MKINHWDIARNGLKYDPLIEWRFKPEYFVESRAEWERELDNALYDGGCLYDEAYPDVDEGGSCGPIGEVIVYLSGPYVFAYEVDSYGRWVRIAYTHSVIAGDMERFRGHCVFKSKAA